MLLELVTLYFSYCRHVPKGNPKLPPDDSCFKTRRRYRGDGVHSLFRDRGDGVHSLFRDRGDGVHSLFRDRGGCVQVLTN
jgi:hypothetical protein